MIDNCPFCGAEIDKVGTIWKFYKCGATLSFETGLFCRAEACYETELAQQAEVIRKALEVVQDVTMTTYPDQPGRFAMRFLKAQSLLPKLEAMIKEKP